MIAGNLGIVVVQAEVGFTLGAVTAKEKIVRFAECERLSLLWTIYDGEGDVHYRTT